MNKIPDYLIDSMCSQIKTLIDAGGDDMTKKLDIALNDIKKMNDGYIPKKVEILLEVIKPKTTEVKKVEEGFNFGRLQSLSTDNLSDMDSQELSDLVNKLAKAFYDYKMTKVRE